MAEKSDQTVVVISGADAACPGGGDHNLHKEFTVMGIVLAVIFFPFGLLCCWVMRTHKCKKCGKTF